MPSVWNEHNVIRIWKVEEIKILCLILLDFLFKLYDLPKTNGNPCLRN